MARKKKGVVTKKDLVWDVLNAHAEDGSWVTMNYDGFVNAWRKRERKGKRAQCPVTRKYYVQSKSAYKKRRIELLGKEAAMAPALKPGFAPKTEVQPGDSQASMIHRYLDTDPSLTFEEFSTWWTYAFKSDCPVTPSYFQVCKRKWVSNKHKEAVEQQEPLRKQLTPRQKLEIAALGGEREEEKNAPVDAEVVDTVMSYIGSEEYPDGRPGDLAVLQQYIVQLRDEVATLRDAGSRVVTKHDEQVAKLMERIDKAESEQDYWKWVAIGQDRGFTERYARELM